MAIPPFTIATRAERLLSPFAAWADGNTHIRVSPPPPGARALPFVVSFHGEHWRPGDVLVWAQSPEHAVERVFWALEKCAEIEKPYRESKGSIHPGPGSPRRFLDGVAKGELEVLVYEHDIDDCLLAGPWASNDGLCY